MNLRFQKGNFITTKRQNIQGLELSVKNVEQTNSLKTKKPRNKNQLETL